jgi:hypothetical protein
MDSNAQLDALGRERTAYKQIAVRPANLEE